MELRLSKQKCVVLYNNEEVPGLDEYKGEGESEGESENDRYVLLPFVTLPSPP